MGYLALCVDILGENHTYAVLVCCIFSLSEEQTQEPQSVSLHGTSTQTMKQFYQVFQ